MAMMFVGARAHGLTSFEEGVVIARHEVDYLRPVDYGRRRCASRCGSRRSGPPRFTVAYELFDDDALASRARSVLRAVRPGRAAARAGSATPERDFLQAVRCEATDDRPRPGRCRRRRRLPGPADPAGPGRGGAPAPRRPAHTALWARLPWQVLVTRDGARAPGRATPPSPPPTCWPCSPTAATALPPRRDARVALAAAVAGAARWSRRWPASEMIRVAARRRGHPAQTAAGWPAARSVSGRCATRCWTTSPIVVTRAGGGPVEVSAAAGSGDRPDGISRTGRLCDGPETRVSRSGTMDGTFCTIWSRMATVRKEFTVLPIASHPNG